MVQDAGGELAGGQDMLNSLTGLVEGGWNRLPNRLQVRVMPELGASARGLGMKLAECHAPRKSP